MKGLGARDSLSWKLTAKGHRRDRHRTLSDKVKSRMIHKCLILISASLIAMAPASVSAGIVSGKIVSLMTRTADGLQSVVIQGATSGKPSCARYDYFMIRDEKSDAGKAQYAMLMAAFLSGATVQIDGSNTCLRWGDGEDIAVVSYVH